MFFNPAALPPKHPFTPVEQAFPQQQQNGRYSAQMNPSYSSFDRTASPSQVPQQQQQQFVNGANFLKQPSPQIFQHPYSMQMPQQQFPANQRSYHEQHDDFFNPQFAAVDTNMQDQLHNFNNPLARPIVSFGFGGKIAVMFPTSRSSIGQQGPFACSAMKVFDMTTVLSQTSYASSLQSFPGPIHPNTSKQELSNFISSEIQRYQQQVDVYGNLNPRALASMQLWQLMKILLINDTYNEQQLNNTIFAIKNMLLEHKKEISSWQNELSVCLLFSLTECHLLIDCWKC